MDYKQIDPDEIGNKVLLDRALGLEQQAFSAELEVTRLEDLAEVLDKDLSEPIAKAKTDAETKRRKANRSFIGIPVGDDDVRQARLDFVKGWLQAIEEQHVAFSTIVKVSNDELKVEDLDAEEKKTLKVELANALTNLDIIEVGHALAIEQYDFLSDED